MSSERNNWGLLLFDTLLSNKFNQSTKKFDLGPGLAESYKVVNPTTVEFTLRKGVKFHDGTDFNASIAKWNIDRAMTHPKSYVKATLSAVKEAQVVDDYTLRLNLKSPSAVLPMLLGAGSSNHIGFASKNAVEKIGDDKFASNPVGTGPMKFKEWVRDQRIVMERFPNHWQNGDDGQPLPYLDGYVGQFFNDQTVALMELRTGNMDLTGDVELKDVALVKSIPSLKAEVVPETWTSYPGLIFNPRQGTPYVFSSNKKLREAAQYATDRQSMSDALSFGLGQPAYYPLWFPGMLGYDETLPRREFNLEKAKSLMAEAGYPNGVDFEDKVINRPLDVRPAEVLQGMLSKTGIRMALRPMDRLPWVDDGQSGKFEAISWDFKSLLDIFLNQATRTGSGQNYAGYSNPDMDKLWAEAEGEYDSAKRAEIYKKMQLLMYEEAYYLTGFMHTKIAASQKGVHDYSSLYNYRYIWKE